MTALETERIARQGSCLADPTTLQWKDLLDGLARVEKDSDKALTGQVSGTPRPYVLKNNVVWLANVAKTVTRLEEQTQKAALALYGPTPDSVDPTAAPASAGFVSGLQHVGDYLDRAFGDIYGTTDDTGRVLTVGLVEATRRAGATATAASEAVFGAPDATPPNNGLMFDLRNLHLHMYGGHDGQGQSIDGMEQQLQWLSDEMYGDGQHKSSGLVKRVQCPASLRPGYTPASRLSRTVGAVGWRSRPR